MRFLASTAIAAALGLALAPAALPSRASAQVAVGVSVNFAPPPLPVYDQPPIPGPGYLWTPGYWAWDDDDGDYYWVPGTWVLAPRPGLLWTPAWWGWDDGVYLFHDGYWGPHIGFYGGVVYGFGYDGVGYEGGYWNHDHFFYNRTVNNITNVHITNVYNKTVIVNQGSHASFNGPGGYNARPSQFQLAAQHERHFAPTPMQARQVHTASADPTLRASANHGRPMVAATARPGAFQGRGVVSAARAGGAYQPPARAMGPGGHGPMAGAHAGPGREAGRDHLQGGGASVNAGERAATHGKMTPETRGQGGTSASLNESRQFNERASQRSRPDNLGPTETRRAPEEHRAPEERFSQPRAPEERFTEPRAPRAEGEFRAPPRGPEAEFRAPREPRMQAEPRPQPQFRAPPERRAEPPPHEERGGERPDRRGG